MVLPTPGDALRGVTRDKAAACRVVRVVDGDTVTLWCPGRGTGNVRLVGFDKPEVFGPNCASELLRGWAATWRLRWMLWQAHEVRTVRSGEDRYGRGLVSLFLDGRDVRHAMIAGGDARAYDGGRRQGWCG